jgi:uncharacterized protein YxjI
VQIDPNQHDRFILRQKWAPIVNKYEFSLPQDGTNKPGEPFLFVQQRRFKFKEDIRFYTDSSKSQELLRIKARQRFDPRARYDVTDAQDNKVGEIQKVFGESLLRSTYQLFDANGNPVAKAREKSLAVALFRRIVGFIPYVDDFANWLPIPYHFDFIQNDQVIATHTRQRWKIADTYTIDASADTGHTLDRRLLLATAIGMDALQAR